MSRARFRLRCAACHTGILTKRSVFCPRGKRMHVYPGRTPDKHRLRNTHVSGLTPGACSVPGTRAVEMPVDGTTWGEIRSGIGLYGLFHQRDDGFASFRSGGTLRADLFGAEEQSFHLPPVPQRPGWQDRCMITGYSIGLSNREYGRVPDE